MILTCPTCDTQYFADDNTIGDSGRSVKCAACGHSWHVHGKGGAASDVPVAVAGQAHEAYRERVRERKQRKSRLAASMAWLVMAILFSVLGASAVFFRNDVVRAWPESANAFRMVGLEVNRYGLDFNTIEPIRTFDGTTPLLTVSGSVINISRTSQPGASVRIGLRDEQGAEVAVLLAPLDRDMLAPGESASFSARLENPPVAALDIELYFINSDGSQATSGQGGGQIAADPQSETVAEETGAP